jgi:hypothetical protein
MACRRRRRDAGLAAQNAELRDRLVDALTTIITLTAENAALAAQLEPEEHHG